MCSRNVVRVSSHISFFSCGDPLCVLERWPENTQNMFAWVTFRSLPSRERRADLSPSLERPADLSPSLERPADLTPLLEWPADHYFLSKLTDLILSFQVPCGSMNILFASHILLFMAGYQNLQTFVFFPVICWSYLRTEIFVTQSIGNKLYSSPSSFIFAFLWLTWLMLSCNHVEPAKFIHALCRLLI